MLIKSRRQMQVDTGLKTEDYPALKYAYIPSLLEGKMLYDPIGRMDVNFAGAFEPVLDTDGSLNWPAGVLVTEVAEAPGTTNVIMFMIGKLSSGKKIEMGNPSINDGFGIGVAATSYTTSGDGDYTTNTPVETENDLLRAVGLQIDWATGLGEVKSIQTDTNGDMALSAAMTITTGGDGDLADGLSAFTTKKVLIGAATKFHGIYVFYTTALPSEVDLAAAIEWMVANPTSGLHPLFKGLPA